MSAPPPRPTGSLGSFPAAAAWTMPAQTAATRHCPDCECEWCSVDPRCFLCGEVGLLGAYPLLRARRR